jgi:hypothetical protein
VERRLIPGLGGHIVVQESWTPVDLAQRVGLVPRGALRPAPGSAEPGPPPPTPTSSSAAQPPAGRGRKTSWPRARAWSPTFSRRTHLELHGGEVRFPS